MNRLLLYCGLALPVVSAVTAETTAQLRAEEREEPPLTAVSPQEKTDSLAVDSLLFEEPELLQEVVVEARKPLVQSDGATLTYNVDEDPAAASSSTLDMLRKVPMVTVDAEENIKVKGKANFKIHINGKEDPMLSADPKMALKSIPASTIRKIEVITEPGAKYEGEGVGGILNIVTFSRQTLEGYLVNASISGSNDHLGGNIYGRTKVKNITASLNAGYYNYPFDSHSSSNTYLEYTDNPELKSRAFSSCSRRMRPSDNFNSGLNMSWEPDTLNLFTLSAYYGFYRGGSRGETTALALRPDGADAWGYTQSILSRYNGHWLGATLSWQHNFSRTDHYITASYMLSGGGNSNTYTNGYIEKFGITEPTPWQKNYSDGRRFTHTLQVDYSLPVAPSQTFEAGAKLVWRPAYSDKEEWHGPEEWELTPDFTKSVRLKQVNDILGVYATYQVTLSKFLLKGGVRYEHTRLGQDYRLGNYPDFMSHLNDVIPNASISFNLSPAQTLRLGYQMRIERPDVSSLNPYVSDTNYGSISYGNPDLTSGRANSVSLSYSNYTGSLGGSIGSSYTQQDNMVSSYSFVKDNIVNNTCANIGHYRLADINGNLTWTIIKDLRLGMYGTVKYSNYFANLPDDRISHHGWSANGGMSVDYTTPFRLRCSLYLGGSTKEINIQGKVDSWSYHGIGFSRSFLKEDRLTVSLQGNGIFTPMRSYSYSQEGPGFTYSGTSRFRSWSVSASVTYRLGSLQSNVKQTGAKLQEESGAKGDLQSGGSSTGL